jgi:hypothetical protein
MKWNSPSRQFGEWTVLIIVFKIALNVPFIIRWSIPHRKDKNRMEQSIIKGNTITTGLFNY